MITVKLPKRFRDETPIMTVDTDGVQRRTKVINARMFIRWCAEFGSVGRSWSCIGFVRADFLRSQVHWQ